MCLFVICEGLGALGSDAGGQGRLLMQKCYANRQKTYVGGKFSMFVGNFVDAVFEEAPGSKNH